MKFSLYIIQSLRDGRYYVGYSHKPVLRLQRHNDGWTKSTKGYIPWKLVHTEEYDSKRAAMAREREIKAWKSRQAIENLISSKPQE